MTEKSHIETLCADLVKEHQRLIKLVERLRDPSSGSDPLPLIEKLREVLIVHFAREQLADGLYDQLKERLVEHQEELDALIGEHRGILSLVNSLLEDIENGNLNHDVQRSSRIHELCGQILSHEKREQQFTVRLVESDSEPRL